MTQTMTDFARAYIECALWSSTDDTGEPLDASYSILDIAAESLAQMQSDCADFEQANAELLEQWYSQWIGESPARAGHDFWLTRNRHGAGFWDRFNGGPEAALGRQLSDAAHVYGSCDLYTGDDGLIYAS